VKRDRHALVSLTVQIHDLDHLHQILRKLETLKDIRRVYRVTKREAKASSS
jgi:(p)ppGpp synthase/HD superfamily hydrolase